MFHVIFLIVVLSFNYVWNLALPGYIKPCSRNDPELDSCALTSARESLLKFSLGDPSRDLPALDPLYVPEMTVFIPNEQGLKLIFKDNFFVGMSKLQMNTLKIDLKKKQIIADCVVNLAVDSQYDLSGKLLIVPLKSSGDSSIKLNNTTLHIKYWYEHRILEDGQVHWLIVKDDLKYEVERAYFHLGNLFNDQFLGDQINKLLNEMWREIVADVGPSISKSLSTAVMQNLAKLLEQVSYDELLPSD